jgi:hypothetical protein
MNIEYSNSNFKELFPLWKYFMFSFLKICDNFNLLLKRCKNQSEQWWRKEEMLAKDVTLLKIIKTGLNKFLGSLQISQILFLVAIKNFNNFWYLKYFQSQQLVHTFDKTLVYFHIFWMTFRIHVYNIIRTSPKKINFF